MSSSTKVPAAARTNAAGRKAAGAPRSKRSRADPAEADQALRNEELWLKATHPGPEIFTQSEREKKVIQNVANVHAVATSVLNAVHAPSMRLKKRKTGIERVMKFSEATLQSFNTLIDKIEVGSPLKPFEKNFVEARDNLAGLTAELGRLIKATEVSEAELEQERRQLHSLTSANYRFALSASTGISPFAISGHHTLNTLFQNDVTQAGWRRATMSNRSQRRVRLAETVANASAVAH